MNASGLWQSASGLFDAGLRQARQAFGYDAVDTGEGKRRAPSGVTRSEDDELPVQKRRKLLTQTRDLARNFALLGWAIRRAAECPPGSKIRRSLPNGGRP